MGSTILPPRSITADLVARIEGTKIPRLKVPNIPSNTHVEKMCEGVGTFDQWKQNSLDVRRKVIKNMRRAGYVWNEQTKMWEHG